MKFKKNQSSLEFLIIFGIAFTLILIMGSLFFTYVTEAKSSLDKKQLDKIGNEIMTTIEKIYFLGQGNKILLKMNLPNGISNISIYHINNSNATADIYLDYLNISYYDNKKEDFSIYSPSEIYIRFNCSNCYHTPKVNGEWISYYNNSEDLGGGFKMIQIKNEGNWVSVDFISELN